MSLRKDARQQPLSLRCGQDQAGIGVSQPRRAQNAVKTLADAACLAIVVLALPVVVSLASQLRNTPMSRSATRDLPIRSAWSSKPQRRRCMPGSCVRRVRAPAEGAARRRREHQRIHSPPAHPCVHGRWPQPQGQALTPGRAEQRSWHSIFRMDCNLVAQAKLSPMPAAGLRELKKARSRQHIADTAARLFAERGYRAGSSQRRGARGRSRRANRVQLFPHQRSSWSPIASRQIQARLSELVRSRPSGATPVAAIRGFVLEGVERDSPHPAGAMAR